RRPTISPSLHSATPSASFTFTATPTTKTSTLSLHDALPISVGARHPGPPARVVVERHRLVGADEHHRARDQQVVGRRRRAGEELDRKSTRLNSSHLGISYAVFCLKKKNKKEKTQTNRAHC